MECRFAKTSIIIFLALYLLNSCGYLENDGIEFQKTIVGKIKMQKLENDNANNLMFAETNESSAGIIEDCKNVYYDSINNKIFVESLVNENNSNFYQITILDANNKSVSDAIKKELINKKKFKEHIKGLNLEWSLKR